MAHSAAHQRLAALSSHLAPPTAPPPDWPGALAALETTFPAHQLSLDLATRQQHGQSWGSLLPPSPPAAILHALDTSDVVAVVRIATRFGIVLIPTGGRTALEGQFTPTCCSPPVHEQWNGVVPGRRLPASGEVVQPRPTIHVSLSRMNQVLELYEQDFQAVVQPGIGWAGLNAYLAERGVKLAFPVDPAPGSEFGGMAGVAGSGTNAGASRSL